MKRIAQVLDEEKASVATSSTACSEEISAKHGGVFAGAGHGLSIRIVTTIPEIEALRGMWSSFEGHRDGNFDFYLEHIRASRNTLRPHIIVVERDGRPVALLAGRLDTTKVEHRIGYLRIPGRRSRGLMFMGFRGEETEQYCTLIMKSLLETLGKAEADYAEIPTIENAGIYRSALEVPGFFCRDHAPELSLNYLLRLSGNFPEVYGKLSWNLRDQIRRKKKKIQKDFDGRAEFVCYTQPGDVETAVSHIEEVARKSYQRGLGVGFRDTESMRRRVRFCAEKGWLRMFVAYLGGQPAGFTIGTVCNETYTSDFLAYDPQYREYSVGTVLQSTLIERCCDDGVRVIDFSAGYADYKKRFGNDCMTVARVYVFAPHWKGLYLSGMRTLSAGVNRAGKYVLGSAGLLPRIKKAWRSKAGNKVLKGGKV